MGIVIEITNKGLDWRGIDKMHGKVIFNSTKLQFSTKKCLVYCFALWFAPTKNSRIKMEDLVRYAIGWDMFKYHYTLLQELRVYHMINRLKSLSMLLDGDPHSTIRLHDLVHYVAIWVAKGHVLF